VVGGLAGYAIGALLLDSIGRPILDFYGATHAFDDLALLYQEWGLWVILIKGLTPIPYKVVTIASGAFHYDLLVFVLASILTRGVRFYAEAALFWHYGAPIQRFVERYLTPLAWGFLILVIGGFVALKFLI
jgi:membrane protein YqaA with SNARE-associated domain